MKQRYIPLVMENILFGQEMVTVISNVIKEKRDSSKFTFDGEIHMKLRGVFADSVKFIERNQLCEVGLWKKFVDQYRIQIDGDEGLWRCGYWGKMMRGACMILAYTKDDGFYRIIEASIRDMLTTQEENGRFSTYVPEKEFTSWVAAAEAICRLCARRSTRTISPP